jgi:hypothetical protein
LSFWAGIILKKSVVMAADERRVYPEKASFEDGRSNLIRINDHTWLAAAGFFPLAGVVLEGFRQVFGDNKVDLVLLLDTEADFRAALSDAYGRLKAEGSPASDLLLGGVSSQDVPYLVPIGSAADFRLRIIREPFATVCLNFAEPLQAKVKEALAPLKNRLAKEALEERRVKAAEAALRQLLLLVAAGSEWVAPEGEMVTVSAKGSRLTPLKKKP